MVFKKFFSNLFSSVNIKELNIKDLNNKINNNSNDNTIFYIGGSEVLPPPLSSEEEALMIDLLESDEAEMVKNKLIERNLRLVVYIARKFENTGINVEDLISIGSIGLIKAINTFKADKNIKLATYATRCIENEILMHLRRTTKLKTEISIDEPLNVDWEGNELLLSDILGTEIDITYKNIEEEVDREMLKNAIETLEDRERVIIELRYGIFTDGIEKTQKEVADILGISQSYISRLEKKIIVRLQKEFTKMM
ncbi:MAG: RNA polymerase sporulation sigma factor SigE [bacterium]